ncbi:MAG: hypothetical protein EA424_24845 [Planctomycetaceae bacterium]|nr:MAG: hypothetical protein EA424_24845 [Planctomycetaceae bacterium]
MNLTLDLPERELDAAELEQPPSTPGGQEGWVKCVVERLTADIQQAFPEILGFSPVSGVTILAGSRSLR